MPKKEEPIPDFDAMTPAQRIRSLDALWDSMERNPGNVKMPAWHAEVLEEREAEYSSGSVKPLDWEDAKKALRQSKA